MFRIRKTKRTAASRTVAVPRQPNPAIRNDLWEHLRNVHGNHFARNLSKAEAIDEHKHEHRGPGTIRNHDVDWHGWTDEQKGRMDADEPYPPDGGDV